MKRFRFPLSLLVWLEHLGPTTEERVPVGFRRVFPFS